MILFAKTKCEEETNIFVQDNCESVKGGAC